MGKNKLAKFADMATYPHVFQAPDVAKDAEPFALRGRWGEKFFKNQNPIVLELGCGRGEYCVGLARLFPEKNFIGVDIKGSRMWTGATESLREGLKNVAFLRTRIEFIERFFAEGEVSEIWLTFSDPQMRKATKRLTSTFFLTRYRHFLVDGGTIHLKTDSNFLFTYTSLVVNRNHLPQLFRTADLYHTLAAEADPTVRSILGIQTYYEQQWMDRGLSIRYLKFSLPATGDLEEPTEEIPFDEYRSYGRSRRMENRTTKPPVED